MFYGLRAQFTSSTIVPIAIIGWLVWNVSQSDQANKALLHGFQAAHLSSVTLNDCGSLTYREGEYFPALCTQLIPRVSTGYASATTGFHFSRRSKPRGLDDRMLEIKCFEVACQVIESHPEQLFSANWSEKRQCWLRRSPGLPEEGPYTSRLDDQMPNSRGILKGAKSDPTQMPSFEHVPVLRAMGRLASNNCAA